MPDLFSRDAEDGISEDDSKKALTQAHVDELIEQDGKVQLQQLDGKYGPIQKVNMLKLAGDFFERKAVEGDLVIPEVNV